jgi:hypothetical protein
MMGTVTVASFRAGLATASVTQAHRLTRMAPKYHAYSPPHAGSRTLRLSTGSTVPDKVAQRAGPAKSSRADGGLTTVIVRYGRAAGDTATGSL